jgi:outer membrane protein, multidrug efflux system
VRSLAVLLLAACASHSTPPDLPALQASWQDPPSAGGGTDAAWWRSFHDPVLDRLIERADAQSLDLRVAAARIAEARALRRGAHAELLPELTGEGNVSYGDRGLSLEASLGASWELDLWGRLGNEERAAYADVAAFEADRDAVRLTVAAEVTRSYIEHRLFQVQRTIALGDAQAQEESARIAKSRYDQGIVSGLDVERTTGTLAETRADVAVATELAEVARHRLVLLLATTPDELGLPPEGTLPEADPLAVLLTPTDVIARRPDVRAARNRLLAAVARRDAAAALRWPRLTLAGLIGISRDGTTGFAPVWSIAGSLLAPLLDFGRIRAQIDVAGARQEQAFLAYEVAARTAINEVQTAIVLYTQGLVRRDELRIAVTSARAAAEIARKQYAAGTISLIEVIDAERTLRATELAASRAAADVSLRLVRLYQTMGLMPANLPKT